MHRRSTTETAMNPIGQTFPVIHMHLVGNSEQGVFWVVRCGTRPSPSVRARAPLFSILFEAVINVASTRFKADKGIMDALVHLRKKRGAGGRGEATVGESVLVTPLWSMLYADNVGVVAQSPEQLRKIMGEIVVVCAAFGLTASEAKTEIICLRAKGMPETTAISSVEAAGQVYSQTNELVYLGGDVNHNTDLSIEVDRRIRNAWVQLLEVHP